MSLSDMQRGARAFRVQQRRESIARVRAYERWLAAGSRLRDIPEVPTDHDYAVARAAGKARR